MTTILRLRQPQELIPVVPHLLHRNLKNEIVVIGMRVEDAPDRGDPDAGILDRSTQSKNWMQCTLLPIYVLPFSHGTSNSHDRLSDGNTAEHQGDDARSMSDSALHGGCIDFYTSGHGIRLRNDDQASNPDIEKAPQFNSYPAHTLPIQQSTVVNQDAALCGVMMYLAEYLPHIVTVIVNVDNLERFFTYIDAVEQIEQWCSKTAICAGFDGLSDPRFTVFFTDGEFWIEHQQRATGLYEFASVDSLKGSELLAHIIYEGHSSHNMLCTESLMCLHQRNISRCERVWKYIAQLESQGWSTNAGLWNRVLRMTQPLDAKSICKDLGEQRVAKLIAALRFVTIRDKLLVYALNPSIDDITHMRDSDIVKYLDDATTRCPSIHRIERLLHILIIVGEYARDNDPEPFGVIAYLCWWCGRSAMANYFAHEALSRDGGYSLAQLVKRAIEVQLPPPWCER